MKIIHSTELNDIVDKTTAQQSKVQQLEFAGFQDPQAAAATSGS